MARPRLLGAPRNNTERKGKRPRDAAFSVNFTHDAAPYAARGTDLNRINETGIEKGHEKC